MTFDFTTITEVRLDSGAHESPEDGMCAMEMVAWFNGEPHSDRPACTCPVLAEYVRTLNDRMPNDLRDKLLKPILPRLVGTVSREHERARGEALVWFVIRNHVPNALRAIGLHDHAMQLIEAGSFEEAGAAWAAAGAAEGAAGAAAWDAGAAEAAAWAAARAAEAAARAAARAAEAAAGAAAGAAEAAAWAAAGAAGAAAWAAEAAEAAGATADQWPLAIQALEEAIAIGPTGDFGPDPAERHEALRQMVGA